MPERLIRELSQDHVNIHSRQFGAGFKDPVVTFCCPTYGTVFHQPKLLGEVIYWYLRQTYPHRELLILNDAPGQKLWCKGELEADGVRIINWPMRIPTLGEKRNLLVMLAAGSVILPQDDDDVSLPRRAEQAVGMLAEADYWTPGRWWFYSAGHDDMKPDGNGYGHNCSAYRRASFYNRYEKTSGDEDAKAHAFALKNLRVNPVCLTEPADLTYVYRWGVSDRHISGYGEGNMQRAYDSFDPGPDGRYELKAESGIDWVARVQWATGTHPVQKVGEELSQLDNPPDLQLP